MSILALMWILLVIASLSWAIANIAVALFAWQLLSATHPSTAHPQKRVHLWLAALLPWALPLISIVTLLALALAKSLGWVHHHCETHQAHHPHFCLEHLPEAALQLSSSAIGAMIVLGAFLLFLSRLIPILQLQAKVRAFLRLTPYKSAVTTLIDKRPFAFTLANNHPNIFISSGLKELLSPEQVRMVISHEVAHVRHGDVRKNRIFETLLTLHLSPSSLRKAWYLSSELRADNYVAKKYGAFNVADMLIKLHRAKINAPFTTAIHGSSFTDRIQILIDETPPGNCALFTMFLVSLLAIFPCALILSHHNLETLWGWLI